MKDKIIMKRRSHGYFVGGIDIVSVWPTIMVSPTSFHDEQIVKIYEIPN